MAIRDAGIIGTSWGRNHVGALRAAGVEVRRLCGRHLDKTRAIADEEGVAEATDQPKTLRDLDLVVIASPPATHAGLLALFPGQARLLEKPVLCIHPPSVPLPERSEPVWVNYAFSFLAVAQQATRRLASLGAIRRARVGARLQLEGDHELPGWFLEVASHPLSYAIHLLGPLSSVGRRADLDRLELELRAEGDAEVEAWVTIEGPPGIRYEVDIEAERGRLRFTGELRLGEGPWRFGPVYVDDEVLLSPTSAGCPWIGANHAAVAALVGHLDGGDDVDAGRARGLFDLERGLLVERALGLSIE